MIDTKFLTFMSLCETKSYTKTAELLYITQPSVTHHIKTLEQIYDVKLFTSNNKNFQLTKQGELLLDYAQQLLAFDNEFERILKGSLKNNKTLNIASTSAVMNAYLRDVLPEWSLDNSQITYNLTVNSYDYISKDLADGKIDFAIIDDKFDKKSFQIFPIQKTKMVVGVNPDSQLSNLKKISFDQLLKEKIIIDSSSKGKFDFFDNELKFKNRSIKEIKESIDVNDSSLAVSLVESGVGVGIFYEGEISDKVKSGKICSLDLAEIKNPVEFNLIYNKNHLDSHFIDKVGSDFNRIYNEISFMKYTSKFKK